MALARAHGAQTALFGAQPMPAVARACACGQHTGAGGACASCREQGGKTLQRWGVQALQAPQRRVASELAGLPVSAPDDRYEREASATADAVLAGPQSPAASPGARSDSRPAIQRAPLPDSPGAGRAGINAPGGTLGGTGQPLAGSSRAFFEPRFGADFSGVRVHSGPHAARMATSVAAHAFTVGPDIVFGAGQYAPHTSGGQRLLAHELAHVAQQSGASDAGRQVQRLSYAELKESAYSGLISTFVGIRTEAMNLLRGRVPSLPSWAQSTAYTLVDIAETTMEIINSLTLAIIGLNVGFVEGIAGLVVGLLSLAYGVLKLLFDLLTGVFDNFAAFRQDIDFLVNTVIGLPAALQALVDDWLERFNAAPNERKSAMIGELTGQVVALIATYAVAVGRVGSASRVAAGGAEVTAASGATTEVVGATARATRPVLTVVQGGGETAAPVARGGVVGNTVLKVKPVEAPIVPEPLRIVPPPVEVPVVPPVVAPVVAPVTAPVRAPRIFAGTGVAAGVAAEVATKEEEEEKKPDVYLHAFGNASQPRAPRAGKDLTILPPDPPGYVDQETPPMGASTFSDPMRAPITGHYHKVPKTAPVAAGLGVVADGRDVGGTHAPTHHTIYPLERMLFQQFVDRFLGLPWMYGGRKR